MKRTYLIAAVSLVVLALVFIFAVGNSGSTGETQTPATPQAATGNLEPQTSQEGSVSITVTPVLKDTQWDFSIILDTHSEELNADLTKAAVLLTDDDRQYPPLSWEGDPSGGHHRSGLLRFPPIEPRPTEINLVIRNVGGVGERKFVWQLK